MSRSPIRDLLVGVFVLSGLAALAYLSIQLGGAAYAGPGGFMLYANFDEIGGLAKRSPVVIGGVKVGQVTQIGLAKDGSFRARVTMDVDKNLKLPDDTQAAVLTQGVLGNQYVSLSPGGSETMLKDGSEIAYTQSAVVMERLIGKLIQNLGGSSGGGGSGSGSGSDEPKPAGGGKGS
jgi:phospholipid/cholesterol/gamma-HCH transport system substrate-binding protein